MRYREELNRRGLCISGHKLLPVLKISLYVLIVALIGVMLYRTMAYWIARNEYAAYLQPTPLPARYLSSAGEPMMSEVQQAGASVQKPMRTGTPPITKAAVERIPEARPDMLRYTAINERFVAWLDVENTAIKYPVAQGNDNQYYATHSFSKKRSVSGAIFLDSFSAPDLKDRCSVIYGHNMKDGSMFHGLMQYKHQSFMNDHPNIFLTTLYEQLQYKVFAACTVEKEDFWWHYYAYSDTDINWLLVRIRGNGGLHASMPFPEKNAYILALTTCLGDSRDRYFIVYAYRDPPEQTI